MASRHKLNDLPAAFVKWFLFYWQDYYSEMPSPKSNVVQDAYAAWCAGREDGEEAGFERGYADAREASTWS